MIHVRAVKLTSGHPWKSSGDIMDAEFAYMNPSVARCPTCNEELSFKVHEGTMKAHCCEWTFRATEADERPK